MANKRKPESKKCRPTGISLPPHILNAARRMAFQRDMSLSALVREVLLERLAQ